MRAVDEAANPREVAEAFPRDNLVMQLVQLDEETGVFRARLVGEK